MKKKATGPGDHTDLTEAVCTLLCEEVRQGTKPTRACLAAGFHKNTWSNWCRKADEGLEPYAERIAAITRAEAMCIADAEKGFARAGLHDWKATQAFLESRAREDYGKRVEVIARVGEIDPATVPDAELAAIATGTASA